MSIAKLQPNLEPLKPTTAEQDAAQQERLQKLRSAAEQFESIFIRQMLQEMRQTIPDDGLFQRGLDNEIFENLFDDEIAKRIASRNQLGFADMIVRQLSGKLNSGEPLEKILHNVDKVQNQAKEQLPSAEVNDHLPVIREAAQKYDLDPQLIQAVIKNESNGNPDAVSPKGAKGLMQLMDTTAKMLGVNNPFNVKENIMAGAKYLKDLLNQFDNDIRLALASYNAGPGSVRRYGGVPPFKETKNYVDKVLKTYNELKSA